MIQITAEPIDPAALLAGFSAEHGTAGAIVSFIGQVRGGAVRSLELDHHPTLTASVIEQLVQAARDRFALVGCMVVHRIGALTPGEPIVFVAAAAEHRRATFDAVDYLMDRLKTEAPLWKREVREDGATWIEARKEDHQDRRRWASNDEG